MKQWILFSNMCVLLIITFGKIPKDVRPKQMELYRDTITKDTISGMFLYEFNVTEKCYERFDQIERTRNLIRYTDEIKDLDISQLYDRGIYILFYEHFLSSIIRKHKLWQNRKRVDDFLNYLVRHSGEEYDANIIYDKSGILSYKKVYAKLVVCNLHKRRQMTPETKDYTCCYSNIKKSIPTYFVIDILEYKVY